MHVIAIILYNNFFSRMSANNLIALNRAEAIHGFSETLYLTLRHSIDESAQMIQECQRTVKE